MSAAYGIPQPKLELPGIRILPVPDRVALPHYVFCAAGAILSPRACERASCSRARIGLSRPARRPLHHRRIDTERTDVGEQERTREIGVMQ
jgi:hypothetical protein